MEIRVADNDAYIKITLIGQFWLHSDFADFEKATHLAFDHCPSKVVVDLTRLSFVSSQGLGVFIRIYKEATRRTIPLVLLIQPGSVRETMELSGFGDLMQMVCSESQVQR